MWTNKNVDLGWNVRILSNTKFEGYNKVHSNSEFGGELGLCSYIGANSNIKAKIGRFCSIGPKVYTAIASHPTDTFVSTHPSFYSTSKELMLSFSKKQKFDEWNGLADGNIPVTIGNDVFIGANVILVGKITIGDGAIIGAGSVVTKDVPPYCIVGGNPAREIKKRFCEDEINYLLDNRWWARDLEWLRNRSELMDDIRKFIQYQ